MDKETLLGQPDTEVALEDTVDIPGKGKVGVRALTRGEYHKAIRTGKDNHARSLADAEHWILFYGMTDPDLDMNEIRQWTETAASKEIQLVVDRIVEISGVDDDEDPKTAYKSFRGPGE